MIYNWHTLRHINRLFINDIIIMFRAFLPLLSTLLLLQTWCITVTAQYFYKDIWNPQQLAAEMAILKNERIKSVSIKSFDDNGEPSEGFFCEKKINDNHTLSETITRSNVTSQSLLLSRFNIKGALINTTDSTDFSINRSEYLYNDSDRLVAIKTYTKGNEDTNAIEEIHTYLYNAGGSVERMIRKKNNIEVSTVVFKTDEKGNVTEEEEISTGRNNKKYFYYYDDNNLLTDVVHYNDRAKRLLPDYMYVYDTSGQIKQMITTEEGGGYYIWNYTYNDRKLRESERCLSKTKKLLGSVQYLYK